MLIFILDQISKLKLVWSHYFFFFDEIDVGEHLCFILLLM